MPSYSRSLRAKETEINGSSPVESVPEVSLHSRIVQSSRESGLTMWRKAHRNAPTATDQSKRIYSLIYIYMFLYIYSTQEVWACISSSHQPHVLSGVNVLTKETILHSYCIVMAVRIPPTYRISNDHKYFFTPSWLTLTTGHSPCSSRCSR